MKNSPIKFASTADRIAYFKDLSELCRHEADKLKENHLTDMNKVHEYLDYKSIAEGAEKVVKRLEGGE